MIRPSSGNYDTPPPEERGQYKGEAFILIPKIMIEKIGLRNISTQIIRMHRITGSYFKSPIYILFVQVLLGVDCALFFQLFHLF